MKLLYSFVALILLTSTTHLLAQQDAQFGLYMMNKSILNPAAAGSDGTNISALYRTQWTNQIGAPKSIGVAADAPMMGNMGLGLVVINSTLGPLAYTRASAAYSYKINLQNNAGIFLGLNMGIAQYSIDRKMLNTTDDISLDQTFAGDNIRKLIPDFGFGAMYKSEKMYIGLTVPHLLQSKMKFINQVIDTTGIAGTRSEYSKLFRHYYFTAGASIPVNDNIEIQPSILGKYVINAPFIADINCNVNYKKMAWAGLGYRVSKVGALIAMIGLELNSSIRLGYAFEYTTSSLAANTGASHEIMLTYHIGAKAITSTNANGGINTKKKKTKKATPYFLQRTQ